MSDNFSWRECRWITKLLFICTSVSLPVSQMLECMSLTLACRWLVVILRNVQHLWLWVTYSGLTFIGFSQFDKFCGCVTECMHCALACVWLLLYLFWVAVLWSISVKPKLSERRLLQHNIGHWLKYEQRGIAVTNDHTSRLCHGRTWPSVNSVMWNQILKCTADCGIFIFF